MYKLGDYISKSQKGVADGIATLDNTGNVPASQLTNASAADSIYTANGTTGARTVTSTGDLTFATGTNDFIIDNNSLFKIHETGYIQNISVDGINLLNLSNTAGTRELSLAGNTFTVKAVETNFWNQNTTTRLRIEHLRPKVEWILNGSIVHTISGQYRTKFYVDGYTNASQFFIIGANDLVGSEDISLQGETIIKGQGTSTGSTLALYDNDSTPNKTWEWLDNGNVNIGQNSIVDLDNKKITFDAGTLASGTSNDLGLIIDGSNITRTGSTSSPLLRVDGDLGTVFTVNSGGYFNTVSDYTDFIALMKNRAGTRGFLLKGTLCDLASTNFRHVGALNNTANRIDQYVSSNFQQWAMVDNNVTNHWIRNGDSFAQASFFIEGITGRGFNVGGGLPIGTEDISLQGETLISKKLELSTTTDGFLMPRLTTAQKNAISSPDTNLMLFDTDLNSLQRYNGSAWVDVSSGGDSIYTADGTLSGNRVLDINNKTLEFKNGSTELYATNDHGSHVFDGDGGVNNFLFFRKGGTDIFRLGAGSQGVVNTNLFAFRNGAVSTNDRMEINLAEDNHFGWFNSSDTEGHRIRYGSFNHVGFFLDGAFGWKGFTVGGVNRVASEDISLQGSTLIKGQGTSTGTTLALYNNDSTPSKTWEWLDNGNVNIEQDSTVDLDGNKLTFDCGDNVDGGLLIDASAYTGADDPVLKINGVSNSFTITEKGYMSNTSIQGSNCFLFNNSSGTAGIQIGANGHLYASSNFLFQAGATATNRIKLYQGRTIQMEEGSGSTLVHWLRVGDSRAAHFFRNGVVDNGFIVGASAKIGTEDISLQGATLINDTLDMNNNRILNAVVNPSVQETTSSATFTINSDQQSDGVLTAMAAATTIAAPTGTPVQSQSLIFRFKDNGTARAITWNAIFRAIGITLPTTTTASKLLYVGCKYNYTDTKWDVVSVQEEA
tara:strand:+ start:18653 stop:21490 length:2838 start_codon:yes stop_codon:yes gene_type:complete